MSVLMWLHKIASSIFLSFKAEDLQKAVNEMYRGLKPRGRLIMSDPICEQLMNEALRNDNRLRRYVSVEVFQ